LKEAGGNEKNHPEDRADEKTISGSGEEEEPKMGEIIQTKHVTARQMKDSFYVSTSWTSKENGGRAGTSNGHSGTSQSIRSVRKGWCYSLSISLKKKGAGWGF